MVEISVSEFVTQAQPYLLDCVAGSGEAEIAYTRTDNDREGRVRVCWASVLRN